MDLQRISEGLCRAIAVVSEGEFPVGDELQTPEKLLGETTEAKVPRAFRIALLGTVKELNARGAKYGAKFAIALLPPGIEVRAWIGSPVNTTEEEAKEIATLFLGSAFKMEPHKLQKDLWVAKAVFKLADIAVVTESADYAQRLYIESVPSVAASSDPDPDRDQWYLQPFSDGDIYFFPVGVQKNKNLKGFQVGGWTKGAKKASLLAMDIGRLWKRIPALEVPAKVRAKVKQRLSEEVAFDQDGNQPYFFSEALAKATVRAFLTVLNSKLTQYDEKVSARERMPNIYRLSHWLEASQRVEDSVKKVLDQSTPEALQALEAAMDRAFTPKFPPVNAVKKQIAKFLASGKMPTLK